MSGSRSYAIPGLPRFRLDPRAACHHANPQLFFPPPGYTGREQGPPSQGRLPHLPPTSRVLRVRHPAPGVGHLGRADRNRTRQHLAAAPPSRAPGAADMRRAGADMSATVIRADARALPLADASVDLIVTSPPYWALRSRPPVQADGQLDLFAEPGGAP